MNIRIATQSEFAQLTELDHHISQGMMRCKVGQGEVIIAMEESSMIGWLRYGYFWDSISQ